MQLNDRLDDRSPATRWLWAVLLCIVMVALSIAGLDRAVSTWSHADFHGLVGFIWLTRIVDPVPPLAALGLAGAGLAALAGWRPGRWGRVLIACCLATLVALAIKDQLKFAFGRTWPETWTNNNPSWIGNGVFGFQPFHGGQGWASFPSGHTTLMAAPMSILWQALPRWRWLWAGLVALVAIGLIGADYHWLSDIIAGAFLGAAAGIGMAALVGLGRA
jgi:membrane-associated phospholipid phosphatase